MNSYSRSKLGHPFRSLRIAATTALLLSVMSGCSDGGGSGDSSPVAVDDAYTSNPGQLTITVSAPGVLGNDSRSDLTAEIVDLPTNHSGTFTLNANGSFTYTLRSTTTATTDSFSYRAMNGTRASGIATVTIQITPPVAVDDTFSIDAPGGSITNANLLANDIPATDLTAELIGPGPAQAASFIFNPNGTFSYQHHGGDATSVSFQYRTKVGAIYSKPATVTITINQPPVAQNVCASIRDDDFSVTGNLAATDPNGVTPTYEIVSQPGNGSVSTTPAGVFTYTPTIPTPLSSRRGMDKFTFRAVDADNPSLVSQSATVTILNDGKMRIMPLGDSITAGEPGSGGGDERYYMSYRRDLFVDLAGLYPERIRFVGSILSDGSAVSQTPPWDLAHEGHPGWCSTNTELDACNSGGGLAQNIETWFNDNPPDVVLLHIGTNDLGQGRSAATAADGVNEILDRIESWEASNFPVTVFVAQIIDDADPGIGGDLDVTTFNNEVRSRVASRTTDRVLLVDLQTGIDPDSNSPIVYQIGPGGDMADDLHPNDSGYNKMGGIWRAALTNPENVGPKYLGLPECPAP